MQNPDLIPTEDAATSSSRTQGPKGLASILRAHPDQQTPTGRASSTPSTTLRAEGWAGRIKSGGRLDFKKRTLKQLGDMVCGNFPAEESFFPYRSSSFITEFFQDIETDYAHDGSTRVYWVADTLKKMLAEPQLAPNAPPDTFARLIARLMDPEDATNEGALLRWGRVSRLLTLDALFKWQGRVR